MRKFFLTGMVCLFVITQIKAQSVLMDWSTSFTPAWSAAALNGTATNIGGSGINCTVNMSIQGNGSFVSPYPRVNANNSNTGDFQVQSSSDAIEIDQNLNNRSSFSRTQFTFSAAVNNLVFSIADIDFPGGAPNWAYADVVTITGNGPNGIQYPVLTKYNNSASIFTISGNSCIANTGTGGGNVSSLNQGIPAQNGTVIVNFGNNPITSITIDYGVIDNPSVANNPGLQAIAIGNMSFLPVSGLPASFTRFTGDWNQQEVRLQWQTASLVNSGTIAVERSKNGKDWEDVPGILPQTISGRMLYKATDSRPYPITSYYRLRETTNEGILYYSKMISLSPLLNETGSLRVYPNPTINGRTQLELNWNRSETIQIALFNSMGQLQIQQVLKHTGGFRTLPLTLPAKSSGLYFIKIEGMESKNVLQATLLTQ